MSCTKVTNYGMTKKTFFLHLLAEVNHVMSNKLEKLKNHNFDYSPYSFLHTDTHVLRSYTVKEENILTTEFAFN